MPVFFAFPIGLIPYLTTCRRRSLELFADDMRKILLPLDVMMY
ncbi:Uncharacterised protein [Salmonella enterica subsp. salamae]|uniref:Uncharacterized protein n=1 Tax=Salmonella enterica subsp. salamae TaxID=59202 RepID=A0A6D2G982_SALER|nr:Uncharacterised protein [Salmonella enterica subsp. salamae]